MYKARIRFEKSGSAAYSSHLDLMKTLQRSFLRAGLPMKYSEGYNPHICMSILVPLSTGYETCCDLCDLELTCDTMPEDLTERLNAALPTGIRALEAGEAQRPPREVAFCTYALHIPSGDPAAMQALFEQPVLIEKRSKRGIREVDLLPYIRALSFAQTEDGVCCRCVLAAGNDPLNPLYVAKALKRAELVPEEAVIGYRRLEILDENGEIFF